eukprot:scaffold239626_cov36-Tisochrysis_lutea.AAC.1
MWRCAHVGGRGAEASTPGSRWRRAARRMQVNDGLLRLTNDARRSPFGKIICGGRCATHSEQHIAHVITRRVMSRQILPMLSTCARKVRPQPRGCVHIHNLRRRGRQVRRLAREDSICQGSVERLNWP